MTPQPRHHLALDCSGRPCSTRRSAERRPCLAGSMRRRFMVLTFTILAVIPCEHSLLAVSPDPSGFRLRTTNGRYIDPSREVAAGTLARTDDSVLVSSPHGIECFDAVTGRSMWSWAGRVVDPAGALLGSGHGMHVLSSDSSRAATGSPVADGLVWVAVDASTGAVRRRGRRESPPSSPIDADIDAAGTAGTAVVLADSPGARVSGQMLTLGYWPADGKPWFSEFVVPVDLSARERGHRAVRLVTLTTEFVVVVSDVGHSLLAFRRSDGSLGWRLDRPFDYRLPFNRNASRPETRAPGGVGAVVGGPFCVRSPDSRAGSDEHLLLAVRHTAKSDQTSVDTRYTVIDVQADGLVLRARDLPSAVDGVWSCRTGDGVAWACAGGAIAETSIPRFSSIHDLDPFLPIASFREWNFPFSSFCRKRGAGLPAIVATSGPTVLAAPSIALACWNGNRRALAIGVAERCSSQCEQWLLEVPSSWSPEEGAWETSGNSASVGPVIDDLAAAGDCVFLSLRTRAGPSSDSRVLMFEAPRSR